MIWPRMSCQSPLLRGAAKGWTWSVEPRVVEPDRDDPLGGLLDLEAQVQVGAREHLHAAEVDVRAHRVRLGLVERPGGRAILRRRLLGEVRGGVGGTVVGGVGHVVVATSLFSFPVDPKPPSPRWLPGSCSTRTKRARETGMTISCAIRSPTSMGKGCAAVGVEERDPDLAAVAGIHRARAVDDGDAVTHREAAPGHDERDVAVGQGDGHPGSHGGAFTRPEHERFGGVEVGAGVAGMGVRRGLPGRDEHVHAINHVVEGSAVCLVE